MVVAPPFRDVETFRTSGNVIFGAGPESLAKLTERIEEGLAESLGYEVAIFLRTAGEIRALTNHQPFSRTCRGLEREAPGRDAFCETRGKGAERGAGTGDG
jgi:uncharacterized protein (DUF1697 family)